MKRLCTIFLAVGMVAYASSARAQEVRIGFLSTFTGGGAVFGQELKLAWELALEHLDGKIGGLKTVTIFGDDQQKSDVGIAAADRMLSQDKVHFVVGPFWSNVMMAVKDRVLQSPAILIGTNAGPSPLAGKECSPYFFSTSWQGDQIPEAMGILLNKEGLKNVYLLAPNYQGGKDVLTGFRRFFKGPIVGETLFKLGATDFQAEFSTIRASKSSAVFVFAPGNMGVALMKQWAASGMAQDIKLYTVFVVDHLTLPAIGDAAIGTFFTNFWDPDGAAPANRRFVRDFTAKHKKMPSHFAAQTYDAAFLIDSGVRKAGGKLEDRKVLVLALRNADFASVRGPFRYNVNHFPVQDFYKFDVIKGPGGAPSIKLAGLVVKEHKDAYYSECKMPF